MAWNDRIPKVLHLYWGRNKPLSFMRWMTVKSFAVLNPDWKIYIYYPLDPVTHQPWTTCEQVSPNTTYEDYYDRLGEIPMMIDRAVQPLDRNSEVHRSDKWRWQLLTHESGVWADFDILFIRPMDAIDLPDDVDVVVSYCKTKKGTDANRIGFLMSASNQASTDFYNRIWQTAKDCTGGSGYQSLGREVLDMFIPGRESEFDAEFYNLPQPVVYPFQPRQLHRMYWTRTLGLEASTVGIHWYAGHPDSQLQQANITERNVAKQPAPFFKLMATMLKGQA